MLVIPALVNQTDNKIIDVLKQLCNLDINYVCSSIKKKKKTITAVHGYAQLS